MCAQFKIKASKKEIEEFFGAEAEEDLIWPEKIAP